ncbi:MAG: terminase small subunit [Oscillospiraceae bacterium]|nr:terminase small subunit [Oscillospiraceae bacterium]
MPKLSRRQRDFCCRYLMLGNIREAAERAGYSGDSAEQEGIRLLQDAGCRRYLASLAERTPLPFKAMVTAGFSRLAFGAANDAVRLAFAECPTAEEIAQLDLFHVTSIRHDRNGFEVKLADRLAAMEKLLELAEEAEHLNLSDALLSVLQGNGQNEQEVMLHQTDSDSDVFAETAEGSELVAES